MIDMLWNFNPTVDYVTFVLVKALLNGVTLLKCYAGYTLENQNVDLIVIVWFCCNIKKWFRIYSD
jgi:hypothetical protein